MKICYSIFLPIPVKELWGNSHCHYMKYHQYFKIAKGDSKMIALSLFRFPQPFTKGDIYPVWQTRTNRHPDGDNALHGLKAYFDGLEAAGVIDNDNHFRHFPIQFLVKSKGKLEVNLRILLERDEK